MKRLETLLGAPRDWAVDLAIATGVGVFLGMVGPFGSYLNGAAGPRMVYWVGMLWVGTLFVGGAVRGARLWAGRTRLPLWFTLAMVVVLAAIPLTSICAFIARALWPVVRGLTPLDWYSQVLVITAPLTALNAVLRGYFRTASAPVSASSAEPLSPVICLQMEDHYVRMHYAAGSRLMHATLSRAIADLGAVEGMQVHRSWWVARGAVSHAVTEGRNLRLILSNGVSVPVARASVAKLRAAGWI